MTMLETVSLWEVRPQISGVFLSYSPQDHITPHQRFIIPYPFLLFICNNLVAVTTKLNALLLSSLAWYLWYSVSLPAYTLCLPFYPIQHFVPRLLLTQGNESKKQSKEKQPGQKQTQEPFPPATAGTTGTPGWCWSACTPCITISYFWKREGADSWLMKSSLTSESRIS